QRLGRGSGLDHHKSRYYSAEQGRFIQRDPAGFAPGYSNLSSYVGDSPTNYTDPLGLVPAPEVPVEPRVEDPTKRILDSGVAGLPDKTAAAVRKWIQDLDDDAFFVREEAQRRLRELVSADRASPTVRQIERLLANVACGPFTAEQQHRAKEILSSVKSTEL